MHRTANDLINEMVLTIFQPRFPKNPIEGMAKGFLCAAAITTTLDVFTIFYSPENEYEHSSYIVNIHLQFMAAGFLLGYCDMALQNIMDDPDHEPAPP